MSKYINADKLISDLKEWQNMIGDNSDYQQTKATLNGVMNRIDSIPGVTIEDDGRPTEQYIAEHKITKLNIAERKKNV